MGLTIDMRELREPRARLQPGYVLVEAEEIASRYGGHQLELGRQSGDPPRAFLNARVARHVKPRGLQLEKEGQNHRTMGTFPCPSSTEKQVVETASEAEVD
jgi:hypothetical protein